MMKKIVLTLSAIICLSLLSSAQLFCKKVYITDPKTGKEMFGTGWKITDETMNIRGVVQGNIYEDAEPATEVHVSCTGQGICMDTDDEGRLIFEVEVKIQKQPTVENVNGKFAPLPKDEKIAKKQIK